MARRRKSRLYKTCNVATKSGGATGAQTLVGRIDKIDAQGVTGYLNNILVSVMVNEAEQDQGSIMCYLTTDDSWDDDYVITARATSTVGGTVNLIARRRIVTDNITSTSEILGNTGPVYLWIEIADYAFSEEFRYVAEVWGFGVEYHEL